jgi:hypothetical protein
VVEDVKATDLPMGDFSLDDVEELPLPTEEEGGVQVDGKSYLPKPKAQPPAPAKAEPSQPAMAAPAQEPSAPSELETVPEIAPDAVPSQPAVQPKAPKAKPPVQVQAQPLAPAEPTTPSQEVIDQQSAPATAEPAAPTEAPPTAVASIPSRLGTGGPDVYGIEKGDNLWDICQRMFGDPFLWPKLWAMNQYITNPHLIFPGDQLRFFMGSTTQAPSLEIAQQNSPVLQPDATPTSGEEIAKAEGNLQAPTVPAGTEPTENVETTTATKSEMIDEATPSPEKHTTEVRNFAFLNPKEFDSSGYISHSGEEKYMLSVGDTVYMKFKDMGAVHVGDAFHIFETLSKVSHPKKSLKKLGYLIHIKGKIRVTKIDERVITGMIEDSWEVSSRDDRLIPYESLIRRVVPKEQAKEMEGYIVESGDQHYIIGQQDIAFVNIGKTQGLEPGDLLRVVRQGDGVYGQKDGLPDVAVGELTVVETLDNLAVVVVNWSRTTLEIGDRVKTRL